MDGSQTGLLYVDGNLVPQNEARISALDRGFTLGDGVFETMRLSHGQIFRLDQHLARLRRSAETIHLPIPMEDHELREALDNVVAANGLSEAVLRLTVSRGVPEARGLLPTGQIKPTIVIQPSPYSPPSPQKYEEGFRAIVASVRRNQFSPLAFIKSCNYLDNILARMEAAAASADEAIMLNTVGKVADGTIANIFAIKAGTLITPSIENGVLAGTTRAAVIELAGGLGIEVREESIEPSDLLASDECFFTNAVIGIMPLIAIDGKGIGTGKPGSLTKKLREAYERLVEATVKG